METGEEQGEGNLCFRKLFPPPSLAGKERGAGKLKNFHERKRVKRIKVRMLNFIGIVNGNENCRDYALFDDRINFPSASITVDRGFFLLPFSTTYKISRRSRRVRFRRENIGVRYEIENLKLFNFLLL